VRGNYGIRFAGFSAKASGGSWLTARNGGAFDRISVTLQYRWFDP
jgi:hypothetical protein